MRTAFRLSRKKIKAQREFTHAKVLAVKFLSRNEKEKNLLVLHGRKTINYKIVIDLL